jgi:hypothetical protein
MPGSANPAASVRHVGKQPGRRTGSLNDGPGEMPSNANISRKSSPYVAFIDVDS